MFSWHTLHTLEAEDVQRETIDWLTDTVEDLTVVGGQVSLVALVADSEASILPSKSGSSTFHPMWIVSAAE